MNKLLITSSVILSVIFLTIFAWWQLPRRQIVVKSEVAGKSMVILEEKELQTILQEMNWWGTNKWKPSKLTFILMDKPQTKVLYSDTSVSIKNRMWETQVFVYLDPKLYQPGLELVVTHRFLAALFPDINSANNLTDYLMSKDLRIFKVI